VGRPRPQLSRTKGSSKGRGKPESFKGRKVEGKRRESFSTKVLGLRAEVQASYMGGKIARSEEEERRRRQERGVGQG